ncbi:MAG: hypothetical protein M1380_09530 [Chloroflexi bacterium]|nr:hypothetical protein [Chloroflexota bacterium]
MGVQAFHLTKKTGTYADALAAIGLVRMLAVLARGRYPAVRDEGWAYAVAWPGGMAANLDDLDYDTLRQDPGYEYVAKTTTDPKAPSEAACIEYEKERERLLNYRERRQELVKARGGRLSEEDWENLRQIAPRAGWHLYQNLNVLQAFGSYNQLHFALRQSDPGIFRQAVRAKLVALARGEDLADIETPFAPKLTSVQAFNPPVGKGINRPKPDGTAAGGLPGFFVDWFEEWLRYIGVHLAASGYRIGDRRKTTGIKVVAMAPGSLDGAAVPSLWRDFVGLRVGATPVHIDVRSVLELSAVLVRSSGLLGGVDDDPYSIRNRAPRDVVAGLQTAFFSNLGSAYALTNTSFIGLPGWFRVRDAASAEAWVRILEEHIRVVRFLDEEKSEEAAMLIRYRDFLSAGDEDLRALFDFWGMYACHAMRKGAKAPVPLFTVQNVGRLLMSTSESYEEIVQSEGFRAVATAIRRATVSEQFHKARTGKQDYEIHYGLFQDLRQKARFKDQVVAMLSGFVAGYNYENARRAEHRAKLGLREDRRRRLQVTQQQLDELVRLIDRFGSEVVTMLLVAYGAARDARDATLASVGPEQGVGEEGEALDVEDAE